jgi:uncharacterized protein YneF (UPF0154 family)|tara:strand:+ start:298 stop:486 length:189 start_codon:yes stop_codon:yes gene_type:complete
METFLTGTTIMICICFGFFLGAYWMFLVMHKTEKELSKELESTKKALNSYLTKYDDDGYEAY